MEEGEQKEVSLEEKRRALFRQQAVQMLDSGKKEGLRPPKSDEQWTAEYVGAMEGLHAIITELNNNLAPGSVTVGRFDSQRLTMEWSEQEPSMINTISALVK